MRNITVFVLLLGILLVPCSASRAQFGGRRGGDDDRDRRSDDRRGDRDDNDRRGGDGERDRGRGGWGGGGGGWGGNPEDFWKRFDKNGDGMIGPDEVDERFRDRLGIDKPIKISELSARFQRSREDRERGREDGRGRGSSRSEEKKPLVPGFGVDADENVTVAGFGPPEKAERDTVADAKPNTETPKSGGGSGVTGNAYVNGVLSKFDANQNGELDGDEIREARLPPTADANKDGKMTREELVAAFPSKSPSSSADGKDAQVRKSYRFASAHERLNGSAKSWIISRDKNGDGQVAMHEFSSTWSDSKVREFQQYDLNGDGVVTAEEFEAK